MPASRAEPELVRFGEFALDLRSGELSKNGSRHLLPVQPFRILALLVRSPGTLVTRDDLRRELWRDDTFVDFEHSLNAAIKRLRQALGDPVAAPRFIETLPRRGYRFKAAVNAGSSPSSADGPVNAPYALLARHYDVLCGYAARLNRHARGHILRAVLPKVDSVCDLGCGSGETARVIGSRVVLLRRNTPLALRTQYSETCWIEDKRFKLVQRGSFEADGRRAKLDFEWLVPSGRLWRHVRETLWHVCWTDAEIRRALRVAGFDLLRCFDGLDVRPRTPGEKRGTDTYYLARKHQLGQRTTVAG
jgi:DNA-binding winged helix-turn-helix (wHTH) protein